MAAPVRGSAIDKLAGAVPFFSAGDAIDVENVKKTDAAFEFDVTGCRYANFYKQLGVPEIGFMLLCDLDYPMTAGFGDGLELTRTQTIMQGARPLRLSLRAEEEAGRHVAGAAGSRGASSRSRPSIRERDDVRSG